MAPRFPFWIVPTCREVFGVKPTTAVRGQVNNVGNPGVKSTWGTHFATLSAPIVDQFADMLERGSIRRRIAGYVTRRVRPKRDRSWGDSVVKVRGSGGAHMHRQKKQGWEVFAEQASREQDPGKLKVLIAQLNRALDVKYAPRLRVPAAA